MTVNIRDRRCHEYLHGQSADDHDLAHDEVHDDSKHSPTILGKPMGLTGAGQATRYVGATTTGAPSSGTFAVGDMVVAQDGRLWVCTGAGSPGTWIEIGGAPVPTGTVTTFAGSSAPDGWLLCDGSAVSRSAYSDLNDLLSADSYPYGNGDGSTTFNLPDLQDRFAVGKGSTFTPLGDTGGTAGGQHSHSISSLLGSGTTNVTGDHAHGPYTSGTDGSHGHDIGGSSGSGSGTQTDAGSTAPHDVARIGHTHGAGTYAANSGSASWHNHSLAEITTGDHSHTSTVYSNGSTANDGDDPPYLALAYIIKT